MLKKCSEVVAVVVIVVHSLKHSYKLQVNKRWRESTIKSYMSYSHHIRRHATTKTRSRLPAPAHLSCSPFVYLRDETTEESEQVNVCTLYASWSIPYIQLCPVYHSHQAKNYLISTDSLKNVKKKRPPGIGLECLNGQKIWWLACLKKMQRKKNLWGDVELVHLKIVYSPKM